MKKSLLTILFILLTKSVQADQHIEKKNYDKNKCLLIYEDNKFIVNQTDGNCEIRHVPCSTFKIAISLIGYDSGFLIDENEPLINYREGYVDTLDSWRKPQNPISWIKNNCIWYSQIILRHIGVEKFFQYLNLFNYGNAISDTLDKKNAIYDSWISSSLKISPREQIFFLKNFLENKFKLPNKSIVNTKNILHVADLENSWKLYGKTGSCDIESQESQSIQSVWFVGWIEKNNRKIIFADYLEELESKDYYVSKSAKEDLLDNINKILKIKTKDNATQNK
jgi:beta-lactamase class D